MSPPVSLKSRLRKLRDPRRKHGRKHFMVDILTIAICAVIGNADSWYTIALWGRTHQKWLKRFLALPHGIPDHETFRRVFESLDAQAFQICLRQWLMAMSGVLKIPHIAIDGKTLCASRTSQLGPLHLVSAWATHSQLSLGQVAVDGKSNEITAIPTLLDLLDLHGALVTIDAMGCQKAIAAKIVAKGGDFLLAVKDNQEHLHADVGRCVQQAMEHGQEGVDYQRYEKVEEGHGRKERRVYITVANPQGIRHQEAWPKLRVAGMCLRERTVGDQISQEVSCFIGSKKAGARYYGQVLRDHWKIENQLHWQLDVAFGEDAQKTTSRRAAENLAMVRKLALMLLKRDPDQLSLRNKRHQAGWDTDYLEKALRGFGKDDKA